MIHLPLIVRLSTAWRALVAKTDIGNSQEAAHPYGPLADDVYAAEYDAEATFHILDVGSADHATVLAALRYYEIERQGEPHNRSEEIHRLATLNGKVVSLDESGIRRLRTRLGFGLEYAFCRDGCGRDEADYSCDRCPYVIADCEDP